MGSDWEQRLLDRLVQAGPSAFAWRRSAAAVLGLDGFTAGDEGFTPEPEVGVARGRHARAGVHRLGGLGAGDVLRVGPLRATSPLRTLVDLAALGAPDLLERAVEAALRRGLVSSAALADPARTRHRPGGEVLREVMARRPPGAPPTESDAETRFFQLCRTGGLPDPVRQLPVVVGRRFRFDAAWPAWMVAVEVDGARVHGPDQRGADLRRQNRLLLSGWLLLRFTWEDVVLHGGETLEVLHTALDARVPVRPCQVSRHR